MSMSREPGSDAVASEPRSSFILTVDHWLVIGPIVAAIFVVVGLLLMS